MAAGPDIRPGGPAPRWEYRSAHQELPPEGRSSTPGPPAAAAASSLRSSAVAHSPAGATIRDGTTGDSINGSGSRADSAFTPVSYTHLRAHETRHDLVCRL